MVLTLHGSPYSGNTKRVQVVLAELGLPYDFVVAGSSSRSSTGAPASAGAGKFKRSDACAVAQPFGHAPYLDDDGFIVCESRTIGRYLARRYGGGGAGEDEPEDEDGGDVEGAGMVPLVPDKTDVWALAAFERAANIEVADFDPYVFGLAWENVIKPTFYNGRPDVARVQNLKQTFEGKLAMYDILLSKTRYVAGDNISIVDLFHLPFGSLLDRQGIDYLVSDRYPNVKRWWKDISSRPSWVEVNRPIMYV